MVEKGRIERSSKKEGAERLRRRDKLKVSSRLVTSVRSRLVACENHKGGVTCGIFCDGGQTGEQTKAKD
ncbi:hypothetical protein Sjap_002380 [Stephania japonica]|uniref:Uncharacterized protein n=1 Tax=Stephania japonica TaxID=461633 RepID=A0AAP0PU46_9MAGN